MKPALRSSGIALLNDDSLLSIWRLPWIAHIPPISPANLFNANIFHPEPRTLAYDSRRAAWNLWPVTLVESICCAVIQRGTRLDTGKRQ